MKNFPVHPIELNKLFKETGFSVMNPETEKGLYFIKIPAKKVKNKLDLKNAYLKIENVIQKHGYNCKLSEIITDFSDFKYHGNYYNIYFNVK